MFRRAESILSPKWQKKDDDRNFQKGPTTFAEFVGYENQVEKIKIALAGANSTGRLKHMLFTGPAGSGKSTLVKIMANESGRTLINSSGPDLRTPADLLKVLKLVTKDCLVFIDEIHSIDKMVQETMYDVMDNFHFFNNGIELNLPSFTFVGATTKGGNLTTPLHNRFHTFIIFQDYGEVPIRGIMTQASRKRGFSLNKDALDLLVSCARRNPRVAIRLIDNLEDMLISYGCSTVDFSIAQKMLDVHEIDKNGFDPEIRAYLDYMANEYPNYVGLGTISFVLDIDKSTVENIIERWLFHISLIRKSGTKGRILTDKALNNEKYGLRQIVMDRYGYIPQPKDGYIPQRKYGLDSPGQALRKVIDDKELEDVGIALDNVQNRRHR